MSFTHALKWSFFSELAAKAIQPLVFIILARLLTPEDFGVMSAALMVISFSQIFWEAGMGKALIQRQTDVEDAANVAFWINIGLGVVVALLLFAAAEPIARFIFHDSRVTAVLQVMTLQVFLGAVSSVHTALLQKDMGFKKLFWVRFVSISLPSLASLPLAWIGMGYWALVAGAVVGQTTQAVMLWHMSRWRPRGAFDIGLAREMGRFGAWVGISGLMAWFYMWADALIVGMFLGSHELGLYQTGNQIAMMTFAILFGPLTPVLYSHLSRIQQNEARFRHTVERIIKALALVAIPLGIIVYALSMPLANALFGQQWHGIELVIGVMALMHGFAWVVGINGEVYRAIGKPSHETLVMVAPILIYLSGYLISIQYGLDAFIWTRFSLALGAVFLHLLVLRRLLGVPIRPLLVHMLLIIFLYGIPVWILRDLIIGWISDPWWQLILGGVIYSAMVATALFMAERNGIVKELMLLTRNGNVS